jgi:hypothetical protein
MIPRIGRFAEADHQHVTRHAEIFDGAGERKAVGRNDADVGLAVDEAVVGKVLWVDERIVDVCEDLELVGDARVIAVARQPVADAALPPLRLDERLDHAVFLRLLANPAVGQNRHDECLTGQPEGGNFARIISVDERRFAFPALPSDRRMIRAPVIHNRAMFVRA